MSGTAAEMRASLLLTLNDELSGGLRRLTETLEQLTGNFARMGDTVAGLSSKFAHLAETTARMNIAAPFERAERQIASAGEKVGWFEARLRGLGAVAGGIGQHFDTIREKAGAFADEIGPIGGAMAGAAIIAPARQYADFDAILRQIAVTEHLSGDAATKEIQRLGALFAEDARRTGQLSTDIAKAYLDFVTSGLPTAVTDKVIGQHSMAATAYNISPEVLGPGVLALLQNLKIPESDVLATVGAMAEAAKSGRFKVTDFAGELPAVTSMMQAFGMTGRKGADFGFAALETAMKGEGLPSSAAAGVVDALNYLTGKMANRGFAQAGVDLPALLRAGEKAGKNPIDTVLDKLEQMTRGQSPVQLSETLHGLLHNLQAEKAILALLQHRDELKALTEKLDKIGAPAVTTDFLTAFAGPATTLRLFEENLAQATRTLGQQFMPTVTVLNTGMGGVVEVLKGAQANFPILTAALATATSALLALAAAAGAKSMVGPFVEKGGALLVTMLGGAASTAALATGLIATDFGRWLGEQRAKAWSDKSWQDHPLERQQLEIHVTADPGLGVHVRQRPGGVDEVRPLSPLGSGSRVLGRD